MNETKQGGELVAPGQRAIDTTALLESLHDYQKKLNGTPRPSTIKKNAQARDAKYIPIGEVEKLLDEMFGGAWRTHSYQTQTVANELIGSIVLEYLHPVLGVWISRVGSAAVPVTMASGSKVPEMMEKKIVNALVTVSPHLKAECIKNAARSIGQRFGRDLNRDTTYGDYESMADLFISFERQTEIDGKLAECTSKEEVIALYRMELSDQEKRDMDVRNAFNKRKEEVS